jgi:urease gamma subunit
LVFDESWINKIHTQIAREVGDRVKRGLTETNVYDTLRDVVFENRDIIHEDLNREVVVQDGIIVVQNHLATETLSTDSDVNIGGALVVDGDLAVKGRISLSNISFDELSDTIEKNAIDKLKKEFISETSNTIRKQIQDGLNVKNIMVRGESLVNDDRLSSGVTKTAIQELGTLKNLQVGTELSVDNKRVGINTNAPRSALSIWDSEIEIDIGRRSQNTAQIGTSKAHNLSFITNNQEQVTIDKDGLVSVKKIRVGRNIIMTHHETPGWSGAKGDIVFNYNYKPGDAFAWLCLGAFRWHELKSA